MKNKNLILIGIILTTIYVPLFIIINMISDWIIHGADFPLQIIPMVILFTIVPYTLGIIILNHGLKKIN